MRRGILTPGRTLRRLSAAALLPLLATAEARAFATAWPEGAPPAAVVEERALLFAHRSHGSVQLLAELRLDGARSDLVVVVATPGPARLSRAPPGAIESIAALAGDGGRAASHEDGAAPPTDAGVGATIRHSAPASDLVQVKKWLAAQKLAVAPGFDDWARRMEPSVQLAFVAAPPGALVTLNVGYRSGRPYYPLSAPASQKVPLDLWVVADAPLDWPATPTATREIGVELAAARVQERIGAGVRAALGLDPVPTSLWLGRYRTGPLDRSLVSDVRFAPSPPPDVEPAAAAPASAPAAPSAVPARPSGPTRESGPGEVRQTGGRRARRQASTFAALAVVFLIGYLVWTLIKRRRGY